MSYRCYEDPTKFDERIEKMIQSLKLGCKPVPFIVSRDVWNKGLELNDGAHRAEALKRIDVYTYPTVFYLKDQLLLDSFTKSFE